jgi:hypothetical protein
MNRPDLGAIKIERSGAMYGIIMTALGSRAFLAGTLTHQSVFFEGRK